jgi:hypothetical protein
MKALIASMLSSVLYEFAYKPPDHDFHASVWWSLPPEMEVFNGTFLSESEYLLSSPNHVGVAKRYDSTEYVAR